MEEGTVRQAAQMYSLVAEMKAIEISVEGMKTLNSQRLSNSLSIAYSEDAFESSASDMREIANRLLREI